MPEQHQSTVYNYTVGIICGLPRELLAVQFLMDSIHPPPVVSFRDKNRYVPGTIGGHLVVATCIPEGQHGTEAAASVASQLGISFPAIQFCLLVGIAGGVPGREDLRLGDVVVSIPTGTRPGVIQYDLGKATPGANFVETGSLQRPPRVLLGAINNLRSDPHLGPNPLQPYLDVIAEKDPRYMFPGRQQDILFPADYVHLDGIRCDDHLDSQVRRQTRVSDHPGIFYGLVASGNTVISDAVLRDRIGQRFNVLCFEMQAAGVCNALPCLVIRGICDYSDSHKTKVWQDYAAATAAAYAKLLLGYVRPHHPDPPSMIEPDADVTGIGLRLPSIYEIISHVDIGYTAAAGLTLSLSVFTIWLLSTHARRVSR
ncbi:purine and uridine phosphorylase [Aspergillus unguis]